jgi:hypothetical protein
VDFWVVLCRLDNPSVGDPTGLRDRIAQALSGLGVAGSAGEASFLVSGAGFLVLTPVDRAPDQFAARLPEALAAGPTEAVEDRSRLPPYGYGVRIAVHMTDLPAEVPADPAAVRESPAVAVAAKLIDARPVREALAATPGAEVVAVLSDAALRTLSDTGGYEPVHAVEGPGQVTQGWMILPGFAGPDTPSTGSGTWTGPSPSDYGDGSGATWYGDRPLREGPPPGPEFPTGR